MKQEPVIVKQFALARQAGYWIIVAVSNGGFSLPVTGNGGTVLSFAKREAASRYCAEMNKELEIERGN